METTRRTDTNDVIDSDNGKHEYRYVRAAKLRRTRTRPLAKPTFQTISSANYLIITQLTALETKKFKDTFNLRQRTRITHIHKESGRIGME